MLDCPYYSTLEVSLSAITRNYAHLRSQSAGRRCAAVVKANAYGLGMERVVPALYAAGCQEFFVATLDEGIALRKILPAPVIIYVFHGCRQGQVKDFLAHEIRPVLNDVSQLEYWKDAGKYALHVDTGMCRLGLSVKDLVAVQSTSNLQLILSHLACANEPSDPKNAEQLALFKAALLRFKRVEASLANSSGVFLGKEFHFDVLRPGCSLYGISPNASLPNPVENVVMLSAPVLQYRHVDKNNTAVGYGATAEVKKGSVLATVEMGYADGFLRNLSNKAWGYAAGVRVPLVGRVSMDMVSMDVTTVPEHLRMPDLRITFIGKEQPVDEFAKMAGTIGYEVFTRLGARVQRVYPDSEPTTK